MTTTQNINQQQAAHLQRLYAACGNAENFSESTTRQERLDSYMEELMNEGIDANEIIDLLS